MNDTLNMAKSQLNDSLRKKKTLQSNIITLLQDISEDIVLPLWHRLRRTKWS